MRLGSPCRSLPAHPEGREAAVIALASWLKLGIEAVSVGIILVALLMAVARLLA